MSELPVVDLDKDFDYVEGNSETRNSNIPTNESKDNSNEIQKEKQISLEAWSKGHVTGLKVKVL